ncbi:hypothetical protein F4821DRAFT_236813 [Hypoxylon rubiginosum]|uniref:Uncharacterized protein n=1 Tax=Hypoxylon rubiginosum TaxID=110542 RepID=A0ACC0D3G1_9PEZI|nr:hypothetical protein F4821DRAFT_236813 [Hypoxylon rubiginosum]
MLRTTGASLCFGLLLSTFTSTALASPTPTVASGPTASACDTPNQTTGYPDYNAFCQCPPYTPDSIAFGNPYLGLVRCDTKCSPAVASQTLVRPENDSLDACMKACTGSFEKAKRGEFDLDRRQNGDYWFCHGVNFVQGELCEFIGSLGSREFIAGGSDCWYLDGLDG